MYIQSVSMCFTSYITVRSLYKYILFRYSTSTSLDQTLKLISQFIQTLNVNGDNSYTFKIFALIGRLKIDHHVTSGKSGKKQKFGLNYGRNADTRGGSAAETLCIIYIFDLVTKESFLI